MTEVLRIDVDGETFDVRVEGGSTQFSWISGPNAGYGFAAGRSGGDPLADDQIRAAIRGFLASIDPATGYVAE